MPSANPLADSTNLPPDYTDAAIAADGALSSGEETNGNISGSTSVDRRGSIPRSSKYPRVAVLLGVNSKWYIPLLLCRALSVTSAVWWAFPIGASFFSAIILKDENPFGVLDVLEAGASSLEKRIAGVEVVLAFLWVCGIETLENNCNRIV